MVGKPQGQIEGEPKYHEVQSPPKARVLIIEFVLDLKDNDTLDLENEVMEHLRQYGTAGIRRDAYVSDTYDEASAICRERCKY